MNEHTCEICIQEFVKLIIQLERFVPDWNELDNIELLFAIGQPISDENVLHIGKAREQL